MRVILTSHGSTGDIYPIIALAVALQKAGHSVRFATIPHYQTEIEAAHDTLSLINNARAATKAQRNEGLISPVEYARRMHRADVDQREAEGIIANSPVVRDAEARVAREAFTVIRGGK